MTVELGSAVPAIVPLAKLVITSPGGTVKIGGAGATVSTVKLRVAEPALPAASVLVTVTEFRPWPSVGVVNGELQAAAALPSTAQVVAPG